jgi:hypothetical protein
VRGENQSGDFAFLPPNEFEDSCPASRVLRLRQEQVYRIFRKPVGQPVGRTPYEVGAVAIADDKIILEQSGNEVFLDIKERLHSQVKPRL